jgi:hypothetical protein
VRIAPKENLSIQRLRSLFGDLLGMLGKTELIKS